MRDLCSPCDKGFQYVFLIFDLPLYDVVLVSKAGLPALHTTELTLLYGLPALHTTELTLLYGLPALHTTELTLLYGRRY